VATVLLVRRDLGVAARVGRLLLDADELDFVPCSDLFSDAFEVFTHQRSTRLSFADMAIAHVAQERAGGLVLTFNKEFVKLPGIRTAFALFRPFRADERSPSGHDHPLPCVYGWPARSSIQKHRPDPQTGLR
jgi:hypothetical protein